MVLSWLGLMVAVAANTPGTQANHATARRQMNDLTPVCLFILEIPSTVFVDTDSGNYSDDTLPGLFTKIPLIRESRLDLIPASSMPIWNQSKTP
jgi:hypothetical protein